MTPSLTLPIRENIRTPDQKRSYNRDLFTRVAEEYDLATRAMSFGRDRHWKRRLVAMLPALSAPQCLDLACGTGDVTFELARRYPGGQILGLDLTAPMIEVSRARSPWANVAFLQGDMCQLELTDESVDIVTGSYALRNAPVLDDALREVRRVLKPGGYAAFLDFAKPVSRWQAAARLELLRYWCGAISIVVHGRPEHAYIAESLRQFPNRQVLRQQLAAHGLPVVRSKSFLLGVTEALVLRKEA